MKDIRLVKNKQTGATKDFAFVEFFTIEDTENVFRKVNAGDIKLNGDYITVQYSKSHKNNRYYDEHTP